jgi:hypothetical protein
LLYTGLASQCCFVTIFFGIRLYYFTTVTDAEECLFFIV